MGLTTTLLIFISIIPSVAPWYNGFRRILPEPEKHYEFFDNLYSNIRHGNKCYACVPFVQFVNYALENDFSYRARKHGMIEFCNLYKNYDMRRECMWLGIRYIFKIASALQTNEFENGRQVCVHIGFCPPEDEKQLAIKQK